MSGTDDPQARAALVHPDGDGALVRRSIDPARLLAAVAAPAAGASVVFVGSVRGTTDDVVTTTIEYEAHEPMAAFAIEQLCTAAADQFRLVACAVEHRLGRAAEHLHLEPVVHERHVAEPRRVGGPRRVGQGTAQGGAVAVGHRQAGEVQSEVHGVLTVGQRRRSVRRTAGGGPPN